MSSDFEESRISAAYDTTEGYNTFASRELPVFAMFATYRDSEISNASDESAIYADSGCTDHIESNICDRSDKFNTCDVFDTRPGHDTSTVCVLHVSTECDIYVDFVGFNV